MIEAVGTLSVQSASLRGQTQASASVIAEEAAAKQVGSFISSRVRVDNLHNVAILEFRNSGGEVMYQYPSKSQIQGYARAAELSSGDTSASLAPSIPASDDSSVDVSVAAPASSETSSAAPAESGTTTQSVIV